MESAGATPLPSMEERVLHHTAILHRIGSALDQMMEIMDQWERSGLPTSPPAPPAASGSSALRLAPPREYDGAVAGCKGFLLYLATVRPTPSGEENLSVLVSCLTGRALEWANTVWNSPDSARDQYPKFARRFWAVFDHSPEGLAAGEWLFHLRQETRSVQDITLEFRTLAAGCLVPPPGPPAPPPMELGGAALRGTRGGGSSCTNCGRRGHTTDRCWRSSYVSREGRQSTSRSPQVSQHQTHPELPVSDMFLLISFPEFSPSLQRKALVDSGAAGNFMDGGLARRLGIPLVPLDQPFPVHSLDSRPLGSGLVREATVPLDMITQGDHGEQISLFLIDSPVFPVVLGIPWLASHNPRISWRQGVHSP